MSIIIGRKDNDYGHMHVTVSGAKNSALPILLSTLLVEGRSIIDNSPVSIIDLIAVINILKSMGMLIDVQNETIEIFNPGKLNAKLSSSNVKSTRYSILLIPILLKLFGTANLSFPGGCDIGYRPIDIHIDGLRTFGVDFSNNSHQIECRVINDGKGEYLLRYPSVTATQSLILFSVLGRKKRLIYNCAREPEVQDLVGYLNACGAKIRGAGTNLIEIQGVKKLYGANWRLIPDRIEIGTFSF